MKTSEASTNYAYSYVFLSPSAGQHQLKCFQTMKLDLRFVWVPYSSYYSYSSLLPWPWIKTLTHSMPNSGEKTCVRGDLGTLRLLIFLHLLCEYISVFVNSNPTVFKLTVPRIHFIVDCTSSTLVNQSFCCRNNLIQSQKSSLVHDNIFLANFSLLISSGTIFLQATIRTSFQ